MREHLLGCLENTAQTHVISSLCSSHLLSTHLLTSLKSERERERKNFCLLLSHHRACHTCWHISSHELREREHLLVQKSNFGRPARASNRVREASQHLSYPVTPQHKLRWSSTSLGLQGSSSRLTTAFCARRFENDARASDSNAEAVGSPRPLLWSR